MVRLVVQEVARKAGINTAYDLHKRTEIPLRSAYRIWDASAKMIALETLDKLCDVLDVPPGQLFNRVQEA